METVLKLEKISKSFGHRLVVDQVDLIVKQGEILGFLGPNGAGKTTTIKIATGFLALDEGDVWICGHHLVREYETAMHFVGGIVENPEMYKDLTGRMNLRMYARVQGGVPPGRIDEVLRLVGLEKRADEKVKRYSLGMKQRISLAQALLHRPKLLILDEPTNGLDPAGIRELRDILKILAHHEGIGIMVSSHQLAEMQLMCDRAAIISAGRILGEFSIDELANGAAGQHHMRYQIEPDDRASARLLLQEDGFEFTEADGLFDVAVPAEARDSLLKKLVLADIRICSMTTRQTSLEQAFLEITGGGSSID